ncbi:MAG: hypothetical protein U0835_26955 [Isosphaeraceae bacterium]
MRALVLNNLSTVVSGGNIDAGVYLRPGADRFTIQGNYLGTDRRALQRPMNHGVCSAGLSGLIGVPPGQERHLRQHRRRDPIYGRSNNLIAIQGNRIGTNAEGTAAIVTPGTFGPTVNFPSGSFGNSIGIFTGGTSAADLLIGAPSPPRQLDLGQWYGHPRRRRCRPLVQGNTVGIDAAGAVALPNGVGISLGTGTIIGGTVAGARNIVSGNALYGIETGPILDQAIVQGNWGRPHRDGRSGHPEFDGVVRQQHPCRRLDPRAPEM